LVMAGETVAVRERVARVKGIIPGSTHHGCTVCG
jgi:hypothetical protein